MQFGFRRHLCSKILGKKQSKENVELGLASPRAPVVAAGGRQWSGSGRGADTATRARGSLATWIRKRWVAWSLVLSLSFMLFVSLFTPNSVSERAGWAAQMSHSLSLDVMEMAEVAALLDRLAAGLAAVPSTSCVTSSSALSARPEPCDRTCC